MKACVLESVGQLNYQEVETPRPAAGQVLVRIKACGICSSDIDRVYTTGTYHFPTIPGHEFSGEIVEVGEGVDSSYVGKRAAVFPLLPCGECPSCIDEQYVHCSNYNYFGSRCDGAFAEYLAAPVWNIVTFPDTLSFEEAALSEPTAVAMHAVNRASISSESVVTVVGSGTIGIIIALRARQLGAKKVVVVGTSERKLQYIAEQGIEHVINSSSVNLADEIFALTEDLGSDVVFECVGSNESIESSIVITRKSGQLVIVGNPHGDIAINRNIYWKILRNELTLLGVWNSSFNSQVNDWKTALEFMGAPEVDLSRLVTHTFPLSEHETAFDAVRNRDVFTIKVMLTND